MTTVDSIDWVEFSAVVQTLQKFVMSAVGNRSGLALGMTLALVAELTKDLSIEQRQDFLEKLGPNLTRWWAQFDAQSRENR